MDKTLFEFESELTKEELNEITNYIAEYHFKNVINIKKFNLLKNIALLLLVFSIFFNIYFLIFLNFTISNLKLLICSIVLLQLYLWLKNPVQFIKFNLKILNKISFAANKTRVIITNSDIQRIAYFKKTYGKLTDIDSKYKLTNLKKVLFLNETIILNFNNNVYISFNLSKNYDRYNDFIEFIKSQEII